MTALLEGERDGVDYEIEINQRNSSVVVLAIHGGAIEPGTDVLARAVAGESFSFYAFRSLDPTKGRLHHVTSHRFDEPQCLALVKRSRIALSIHGHDGAPPWVFPGGRNAAFRKVVMDALITKEVPVRFSPRLMGLHPRNVVNLPEAAGVQIEFTWGLRSELISPLSVDEWAEARLTDRGEMVAEALRDAFRMHAKRGAGLGPFEGETLN